MDQASIDRLYVPSWENFLQWGHYDAQECAMYALRSHGYEVWAEGYWEDMVWMWRPPGKEVWCVVDPDWKHHRDRGEISRQESEYAQQRTP